MERISVKSVVLGRPATLPIRNMRPGTESRYDRCAFAFRLNGFLLIAGGRFAGVALGMASAMCSPAACADVLAPVADVTMGVFSASSAWCRGAGILNAGDADSCTQARPSRPRADACPGFAECSMIAQARERRYIQDTAWHSRGAPSSDVFSVL